MSTTIEMREREHGAETTSRPGRRPAGKRAIAYVRVSRVGGRDAEGEAFHSPTIQRETIAAKMRERGLDAVELIEELDESGGDEDRPGFQRALDAIEAGRADVIVVARLSRFARSVLATEKALQRIERVGGRLLACDLDVDTSTPQGRLMRGLFAQLAQFELELASEQWAQAKAKAIEGGKKLSTRAPFGYRFDAAHRLEVVPAEAELVVGVFERRAAGESWSTIARWFAGETGRKVAPSTLDGMIRNEAYLGHVVYGELRREDVHAAIVTPELRAAALQPSTDWKAGRPTRSAGARSLLAGIARCGSCGGRLGSTATGAGKRTYRCTNAHCSARVSILEAELDGRVETSLLAWAAPVADELVELELAGTDEAARRRAELEQAIADAELAVVAYMTAEDNFDVEPAIFQAGLEARKARVLRLQSELDALGEASELEQLRTTLRVAWPTLPLESRRRLLDRVVVELVVERGVRGRHSPERVRLVFGETA